MPMMKENKTLSLMDLFKAMLGQSNEHEVKRLQKIAAQVLAKEAAAVDWFRDAFGHLKAIAACGGTRKHILSAAGIKPDKGVVEPDDVAGFIALAKTRQWAREPKLRTLA